MRLGREYREAQFVKDVEWEVHSTWKSVKVISDASHDQIWQELKQIQQVLVGMLGRPSRWSGIVELTEDPYIRGAKPFRCDIIINAELSEKDLRWRTLIHEMLHTFSAGYQPLDYASFRGWEEGIVEQLQRVLRPATSCYVLLCSLNLVWQSRRSYLKPWNKNMIMLNMFRHWKICGKRFK